MELATKINFKLNTGNEIPALGLGTVPPDDPSTVKNQVLAAVRAGYRHIDTAWYYGTEKYIGQALQELFKEGYKREDLFITTKVWPLYWHSPEKLLDTSLKDLQLDHVDLLLHHWPILVDGDENGQPTMPRNDDGTPRLVDDPANGTKYIEVYHELERIYKETDKVKQIGVSNYSIPKLRQLLKQAKVVPVVNQIEYHPQLPQQDLVDFCQEHGIIIEAYSPVGAEGAPVLELKEIKQLAAKYQCTENQVANAYHILQGRVTLPRLSNLDRIKDNAQIPKLTKDELASLYKAGEANPVRYHNEDWGYGLGFRWWQGDTLSKQFD